MTAYWKRALITVALGALLGPGALAGDLKITIPRRSHLTPVQRLNRGGVDALRKNQQKKARELFYRAYVLDPGDPFTLNNLGYIAELEGQTERAQTFYRMAAGEAGDAVVDRASSSSLEGETLHSVISDVHEVPMQINRANVMAVRLLSKDRPWEAERLLQRTLTLDPNNGFTLNNMGVTKEAEGDFSQALQYYSAAANSHTGEAAIVTMKASAKGKSISEIASASARRLRERMNSLQSAEAQAALFNLRGVSALNRNDWRSAAENFSRAYSFGPASAFSLNNQGYMAELNGDLETAQEFYREAQRAGGASDRVGLATRSQAEGVRLYSVANESEADVTTSIDSASQARRRSNAPVQLKRRDGSVVDEPPVSKQPSRNEEPSAPPSAAPPQQ